jgi:hypothetical protein
MAVRGNFGAVSSRWEKLTEEQRIIWCRVAHKKWSKPRLCQKGRLTGILLFMKVNVALANRGLAQVDLPRVISTSPNQRCPPSFNPAGSTSRRWAPCCSSAPTSSLRVGRPAPRSVWPTSLPDRRPQHILSTFAHARGG